MKDLISIVYEEMSTDSHTDRDNKRIVNHYRLADLPTKEMIDDIFISLCGYSLGTLINRSGDEEGDD